MLATAPSPSTTSHDTHFVDVLLPSIQGRAAFIANRYRMMGERRETFLYTIESEAWMLYLTLVRDGRANLAYASSLTQYAAARYFRRARQDARLAAQSTSLDTPQYHGHGSASRPSTPHVDLPQDIASPQKDQDDSLAVWRASLTPSLQSVVDDLIECDGCVNDVAAKRGVSHSRITYLRSRLTQSYLSFMERQ